MEFKVGEYTWQLSRKEKPIFIISYQSTFSEVDSSH